MSCPRCGSRLIVRQFARAREVWCVCGYSDDDLVIGRVVLEEGPHGGNPAPAMTSAVCHWCGVLFTLRVADMEARLRRNREEAVYCCQQHGAAANGERLSKRRAG